MALDDTQLIFNSNWPIEQVVKHDIANVTAGVYNSAPVLLVTWASLGLSYTPRVIVTWKDTGDTVWQMNGASNGTYVGQSVLKSDGLYFGTDAGSHAVNVRYTIYQDKVQI